MSDQTKEMNRMKRFLAAVALAFAAVGIAVIPMDAEAGRKLGGGKSFGMQRDSNVMKRDATPDAPSSPAAAAPAQRPGMAGSTAPAAQPQRSWLGPLAGLAAGLGLGALLAGSGLGGMMGTLLMGLLIAAAVFMVLRMLRGRSAPAPQSSPMQYAGAGAPAREPVRLEPTSGVTDPVPGIRPSTSAGATVSPHSGTGGKIPADFDVEAFVRNAKLNFVRLQAAFDAGNADDLREFTTPEVFAELKLQLTERSAGSQPTDVVALEAEVLDVTSEASRHVVSVRFQGQLREDRDAPLQAFDEVWHLTKPVSGGGWVVAGIQQMETA
jgi:predicted lipid-binding transport protein (Tim44 family)